jgi:DEAD/DEAH box helicase domain-containing protein
VLICGDDPLQQYLARNPDALRALLTGSAEDVVVSPETEVIARRSGLVPGQEELDGIAFEDEAFIGPAVRCWLQDATGSPAHTDRNVAYWRMPFVGEAYESLRNAVAGTTYAVLKMPERTPIGVVDAASAPRDAFVSAIWTGAGGELFQVDGYDTTRHEVYCHGPINAGFQTRGISVDRVTIESELRDRRPVGPAGMGYGNLGIVRRVFNYREQHFSGLERTEQVSAPPWPPQEFRTNGLFLQFNQPSPLPSWENSVRALEHVLLSAAPSIVACDPYDLESSTASAGTAIYIYDSFGGDLRLGEPIYDHFGRLVELAYQMVATCPCPDGCPSCIMLSRRPDGNQNLDKAGALVLLDQLRSA